MSDLSLAGSAFVTAAPSDVDQAQYFVDGPMPQRPASAFQRRHAGGGGGAGGGRGGLGSRHATKARNDVLPRTHNSISAEASRYVATKPIKPTAPKAGAFDEKKPAPTNFRVMYDRGDLPLRVAGGVHSFVRWHVGEIVASGGDLSGRSRRPIVNKTPPNFNSAGGPEYEEAKAAFLASLDYKVWLPLFFEGLREQVDPCRFLAVAAVKDLLAAATFERLQPVVPLLVMPVRLALNTREPGTVRRTIEALRQLVRVPPEARTGARVGELLAPYFRHFLPIFNLFKSKNSIASATGDYQKALGEVMDEILQLFADEGGPGAAKEINRIVPLFTPAVRTVTRGPTTLQLHR